MIRRHLRLLIWIAILLGFGLAIGRVPLFGTIGFELSVAANVVGVIMGLDVGAAAGRRSRVTPAILDRAGFPGRAVARGAGAAAVRCAALILVPAVVALLRGLFVRTCDLGFGLFAYLALPIASAAIAGAYGFVIGTITGPRRFLGAIVAQLPVLGLVAYGAYRLFAAPPVFTYNPLVGYFPGNLYDEHVQIALPLVWARLEQLAWLVALGAVVALRLDVPSGRVRWREPRPAGRRWRPLVVGIVGIAAAITLHVQSGALGYAVTAEDIEAELDGRVETAHFVIHYARTKAIEDDLAVIVRDHEFRYAQVVALFGVEPAEKIHSFYFANTAQKARWIGARDVEMAKPWRREIYLDHRAFPHHSLRHEIAHAVAAEFGDPLLGVAIERVLGVPLFANPGLIEGLAVAADWPGGYDHPTPHESVRAMTAMGMTPPLDQLLSLQFLSVSSARGYTTAGSFMRFLLERYGAKPIRTLYGNGGDFEAAYGMSRAQLESQWHAMIATIALPPESIESSRERFRRGSIFARPCPHAVAKGHQTAARQLAEGDRKGAIETMRELCRDAPGEPRYRMELGDYLANGDERDRVEAQQIWEALAADEQDVTPTVRAEAYDRLARFARDKPERIRELIAKARALPVESTARRQLDAEAFALDHAGPAGTALRGYFFDPTLEPVKWAALATLAEPELGFGHYLAGLQAYVQADHARAAIELDRALALGLPGAAFVKNGARRLAIAAYRAGDRMRLGNAIAQLSALATPDRLLALDWQARVDFDDGFVPLEPGSSSPPRSHP